MIFSNIFKKKESTRDPTVSNFDMQSSSKRYRFSDISIDSIYMKLANDASAINIRHVRVDNNEMVSEFITDELDYALNVSANKDQTGRIFIYNSIMQMFKNGNVAIVPTMSNNEKTFRIGNITQWKTDHIYVDVYDDISGITRNVLMSKSDVAIIINPYFDVMNSDNSTLKRISRKLAVMDKRDNENLGGRLDMLIKLPYMVKTSILRKRAEERINDINAQLAYGNKGIAYIDASEQVIQLNRPVETQSTNELESLYNQLYGQLGLSNGVFNGTANELEMNNYYYRTIAPILHAITDEFNRKLLSKTAYTQGHRFKWFDNPFKLVPVEKISDIADKLTRNAILTSNEVRAIIGYVPSDEPIANELSNKNMIPQNEGGISERMNYETI